MQTLQVGCEEKWEEIKKMALKKKDRKMKARR